MCAELGDLDGLRLRPWAPEDAGQLVAAWADTEVARWNPVPANRTESFAASWITGAAAQTTDSRSIDLVAVSPDAPDVVLGELGLQTDRERGLAEVGFWVAETARKTGVATALLTAAVRVAEILELKMVVGLVDRANEAALRTFLTAGWLELETTSNRRAFGVRL